MLWLYDPFYEIKVCILTLILFSLFFTWILNPAVENIDQRVCLQGVCLKYLLERSFCDWLNTKTKTLERIILGSTLWWWLCLVMTHKETDLRLVHCQDVSWGLLCLWHLARLDCYVQGHGHSDGWKRDWMFVSHIRLVPLVSLQPNLMGGYSVTSV